jgi:hypothetical protein
VDEAVDVCKVVQLVAISHAVNGHLEKGAAYLNYEAECENPHRDHSVQVEDPVVDGDGPPLAHFDNFIQKVQHIFC